MRTDGKTAILGLIGNPVAHSYSPLLHNSVFEHLGLNASYIPLQVRSQDLARAVDGIRAFNFIGVNVTIPFKEAVIPYLDEIQGEARECHSVNVIANQNGRLVGYNTDGPGFFQALQEAFVDFRGSAVLIGAGGAARAVAFSLARSGLSSLTIFDLDEGRAGALAKEVHCVNRLDCSGHLMCPEQLGKAAQTAGLVVNCSPVGMHPGVDESPVEDIELLSGAAVLCDLIYNPPLTRFLAMGQRKGMKVLNGLPMFVHQAALTQKILLGIEPPIEFMKEVMAREAGS